MANDRSEHPELEIDASPDEEEDDILILTDAEGNDCEHQILTIFKVENARYIAVTSVEEYRNTDENAEMEITLFGYEEDEDGTETLDTAFDEKTFAKVQAEAKAILVAMEDDDMAVIPDAEGNDRRHHIKLTVEVNERNYVLLTLADAPEGNTANMTVLQCEEGEDGTRTFSDDFDDDILAQVQAEIENVFMWIEAAGSRDH